MQSFASQCICNDSMNSKNQVVVLHKKIRSSTVCSKQWIVLQFDFTTTKLNFAFQISIFLFLATSMCCVCCLVLHVCTWN